MTLKELLSQFPATRTGSKWPGLRVKHRWDTYRITLDPTGEYAIVKGLKGRHATREYAAIGLREGVLTGNPTFYQMLSDLRRDPLGFTDEHGKANLMCCFCGAPLSTDDSTYRGYGPVCAKRYNLPWKKEDGRR